MAQTIDSREIQLKEEIGRGKFSIVNKAKWNNKTIAVKIYNRSEIFSSTILANGYSQLLSVDNENILKFYGNLEVKGVFGFFKKWNFLLMEYADCGSLHQQIHGSNKPQYQTTAALKWMHQCAQGVAFLHAMKPFPVVHHNLKPHNLFLTDNFQQLKIGELAFDPRWLPQQQMYRSIAYMPPEGWNSNDPHNEKYDVFSFGVVLWEVLTRQIPLFSSRVEGSLPLADLPPNTASGNQSISSLIESCCRFDSLARPNMETVTKRIDSYMGSFTDTSIVFKIEDMQLDEAIGSGAFGIVYKSQYLCVQYALKKCIVEHKDAKKAIEKEVKYLSQVTHKNIVKLFGTMLSTDLKTIIVMEYADCGTLYDYLHKNHRYNCLTALDWMHQLAQGLQYLHGMQPKPIIHRDIKSKNLLLANKYKTLKIADFGTVTEQATLMTESIGTAQYMAPEVAQGNSYTEKSDVYSFGIVFWEVMSQKIPFYHLGNNLPLTIVNKVSQGDRPPIDDVKYYPNREHIQSMIKKCWNTKPKKRLPIRDLAVILSIDLHSLQLLT